jgi:hypothetical protein
VRLNLHWYCLQVDSTAPDPKGSQALSKALIYDLLQIGGSRGVLVESQHQVGRKVPGFARVAPAVLPVDGQAPKTRVDYPKQRN